MEYVEREPPAALDGVVRSLWFVRGLADQRRERVFPMPTNHLIVTLGDAYGMTTSDATPTTTRLDAVFCSGLRERYVISENPAWVCNAGAVVAPDALGALGLRPREVAGDVVDVTAALPGLAALRTTPFGQPHPAHHGSEAPAFLERPTSAADADAEAVLDALTAALVGALVPWSPHPVVRPAIEAIDDDPDLPLADVAARVGRSHPALVAAFRRATGITPKLYADLVRFDRLVAGLARDGAGPWAEVATAHGYYDQSHLIRRFKAFTGFTPRAYWQLTAQHGPEHARFVGVD